MHLKMDYIEFSCGEFAASKRFFEQAFAWECEDYSPDYQALHQAGIDAGNQKLTNVAAGTEATDAVNVSQLNAVSGSINNLSNRINEVEDNANAGTATAIAIANLPQAYEPGARVFSVAAGTYEGETGYAVGYSAISDGGNWIIKASGTANSQQKFGAGAGVGYRWR